MPQKISRPRRTKLTKLADRVALAPTGIPIPQASDYGYSDGAASSTRPAFERFTSRSASPRQDIYAALPTLRSRSRILAISAPLATSAIRALRTAVVGRGLHLHCTPDFDTLGIPREVAKLWAASVEKEFELWAADRLSADLLGMQDFYELQQLAFKSWKESGDAFVVFRHSTASTFRPYSLRLQLIEADRVCTPTFGSRAVTTYPDLADTVLENGNKCLAGVELDKSTGAVCAYHIASDYPQNSTPITFERIEKLGRKTGMPNILHLMDAERPEQLRGVPLIAPVIEPLLQLARYLNAEALAALMETYHCGYVVTNEPDKPLLGQAGLDKPSADDRGLSEELDFEPGGLYQLLPGEDIKFNDPKRPGTQFAPFTDACAKYIGAALEIPGDVLLKSYNSSYSASRAALQDYWRKVIMERDWFASDFCAPVFREWLTEAVASGRVDAPGYFTDPVSRAAWQNHQWNGSAMPHLDPVKEANAMQIMTSNGWITHQQATTQLNGGDWDANIADLAHEMEKLRSVTGLLNSAVNLSQPQESQENEPFTE